MLNSCLIWPPNLPLKIKKGGSILPDAVSVRVSVACFASFDDLQMSTVQVPWLSKLHFPWREMGLEFDPFLGFNHDGI